MTQGSRKGTDLEGRKRIKRKTQMKKIRLGRFSAGGFPLGEILQPEGEIKDKTKKCSFAGPVSFRLDQFLSVPPTS